MHILHFYLIFFYMYEINTIYFNLQHHIHLQKNVGLQLWKYAIHTKAKYSNSSDCIDVLQSSKAKVVAFPGFWRMAACCVNRLILYIVSKVLQTGLFVSRLQVVYYHLAQLCTLLRRSERTNPIDFRSIDCISFKICNRQRRQKENHPKSSKFC